MEKVSLTYAAHSAVLLEMGGIHVAIDPWLKGNPLCPLNLIHPKKLDLIVVSHGHADHAGDVVRLANETGAKVAATYELAMILQGEGVPSDQIIPMNKGGAIQHGALAIRLTHAFHSSSFDGKSGTVYAGEACGVIVTCGSSSVYHAGDTDLFSDMKLIRELYQPRISLLPIGDRFTMGPREAALAAQWLGSTVNIPIHYKTFELLTGTYEQFAAACDNHKVTHCELEPGETKVF